MGHSLGLSIIAEGVEDEQQYTYLQKIGCNVIQGYYFSKPVGATMIAKLLEDGLSIVDDKSVVDYEVVTELKEYKR